MNSAWRLAEATYDYQDATQAESSISLQILYALIQVSLNSLSSYVSPHMLAALVRSGVWTPARGLAYANMLETRGQRASALASISPHLPDNLKDEVMEQTLSLLMESADEKWRAYVLAFLGQHLSEPLKRSALQQIFKLAGEVENKHYQALELSALSPYLSASLLEEAVEAARKADSKKRVYLLMSLLPHLSEPLRTDVAIQILADMRHNPANYGWTSLLPALASYAPGGVLFRMRLMEPEVEDDWWRPLTLVAVAPYVFKPLAGEALQKTLDLVREIRDAVSRGVG